MKKLFLTLAVVIGSFGVVHAEMVSGVPEGPANGLASADYSGVSIATLDVTANVVSTVGLVNAAANTNLFSEWLVYGVTFTTGACGNMDYISVFTSTSGFDNRQEVTRFYNVYNSTSGSVSATGMTCSGYNGPPRPMIIKGNIFARNSATGYTNNLLHVWRRRTY